MSNISRRKFLGKGLLALVGGLGGLKVWHQSQMALKEGKTLSGAGVRKFTPLKIEKPAKVWYTPMKPGQSPESWAEKIHALFLEGDLGRVVSKDKLVAVKQHFGEKGNEGYIRPQITRRIVDEIKKRGGKPSLIETNTLYVGSRANSHDHIRTAYEHGFTVDAVGAPIVICDGLNGQNQQAVAVPGKHSKAVYIASDVFYFDSIVVLSHVKGHMMTGMGGAVKNLGMGLASRSGKLAQHAVFRPTIDWELCNHCGDCPPLCPAGALYMREKKLAFDEASCIGCGQCLTSCGLKAIKTQRGDFADTARTMERMAEHALGAVCGLSGRVAYVNVVNHITKACDCHGGHNEIIGKDVGILASFDPVAIDVAAYDLVKKTHGEDIFRKAHPKVNGMHTFDFAEELGLGTKRYELIERA